MKQYRSSDIRNFAIVGHGSSGKTSLAEAFLKLGGEINRMGTIESGSTVSDYHEGEKERQISIHAAPLHMEWEKTKFNIVDSIIFNVDIISSLSTIVLFFFFVKQLILKIKFWLLSSE